MTTKKSRSELEVEYGRRNVEQLLRKASEARVDRRLRRYYLIVLLLPNIFALACLPLSSI